MAEQLEIENIQEMGTEVLCELLAPTNGVCRLHIDQIVEIEEELRRRGEPNG